MACTVAPERREAKETRRKDHELGHYSTISRVVPTQLRTRTSTAYRANVFAGAGQRIATPLGEMSFLSSITVFGTANDVTLAVLALEMLLPADDQTAKIAGKLAAEQGHQARTATQSDKGA